jgi:hypothetical protein
MGKGRYDLHPSRRCAQAPGERGRSSGRGHGRGRDHGDRDRGCSQDHGHGVAESSMSLRNKIAGDYLAIAQHLHVVPDK